MLFHWVRAFATHEIIMDYFSSSVNFGGHSITNLAISRTRSPNTVPTNIWTHTGSPTRLTEYRS